MIMYHRALGFETEQEVELYDNTCQMHFTDDAEDAHGFPCRGYLLWADGIGKCSQCGATYEGDE